ncbi:MAG TPA: zinc metalloprotease HtpX [Methanobacterium sp.]|nr:zinc metalloprotease HtpX [Methanobacterium sp.]
MKKFSTLRLTMRLYLAIALLFFLLYVIVTLVGYFLGFGGPTLYALLAIVIIIGQYLLGPKLVEMTMRVRYVSPQEAPKLHAMVDELAMKAGIPKPKVGISEVNIPNAFAFGRTKKDGRVCVTRGILNVLNEGELKAVLGHELSHINHRDMAVITLISAVPLIFYYIFISTLFSGGRDDNAGLIGIVALVGYLLSELVVLFVSRVREYYADQGSVELGNPPHELASALYKLTYTSATADKREVKEVEGVKAFFVNDISSSSDVVSDLKQLDLDMDGTISESELEELKYSRTKISTGSRVMEILSTHPNMVKRVKRLSELG